MPDRSNSTGERPLDQTVAELMANMTDINEELLEERSLRKNVGVRPDYGWGEVRKLREDFKELNDRVSEHQEDIEHLEATVEREQEALVSRLRRRAGRPASQESSWEEKRGGGKKRRKRRTKKRRTKKRRTKRRKNQRKSKKR